MRWILFSIIAASMAIGHGEVTVLNVEQRQSLKEHFREKMRSYDFKEAYNQMVANPQIAREAIREELKKGPDDMSLARSLVVLDEIGEKEDAQLVLPWLNCRGDISGCFRVLRIVTKFGDYRVSGAVEVFLYEEQKDVRGLAIQYFENQKTKWSHEALRRFLEFQPKNDEMKKDQDRVRSILKNTTPPNK